MKDDSTHTALADHPRAVEQAGAARPSATRIIVVNGRSHRFAGDVIDRQQIARLAYPAIDVATESSLTVAHNGGRGAASGLLAPGRAVEVTNGQTFSVSITDKS